jgi:hypothetical protein
MRKVKWDAFLSGLCGVAVALGVVAASARADVTTENGASILVFPKVQANGTFDTVIQITNTGNSMLHAHCFYVDASLRSTLSGFSCKVPSATCLPSWQETDFLIWLTKQQPTHWVVSEGRNIDPLDNVGKDKNGAGFDPGRVPPVSDFVGELKCIEVSESDEPITGNHLKGEATIEAIADTTGTLPDAPGTQIGDVSKYNAIGILGNPDVQPTNPLLLDDQVYNACPAKLIVNHFATGADDPIVSDISGLTSSVATELTLVPCSEDFENQRPKSVTVQFLIYNELEQRFSASTTVTCYLSVELTDIDSPGDPSRSAFSVNFLGTSVAQTEITPVVNLDGTTGGLIGVVERIVSATATTGTVSARAAYNLHTEGSLVPESTPPDQIVLPALE